MSITSILRVSFANWYPLVEHIFTFLVDDYLLKIIRSAVYNIFEIYSADVCTSNIDYWDGVMTSFCKVCAIHILKT